MRGLLVATALLAGCYQPVVPLGVRCSPSGECPEGQRCDQVRDLCERSPLDANVIIDVPRDVPLDTAIDAPMLGAWNPPAFLSSLNDPAAIDTDPTISADGLELFFGSDRPGVGNLDIWHSTRTSLAATFAAPTLVAELATIGDDSAPAISGDGLTIYFRRGTDIFRATRATTTSPFTSVGLDAELSSAELDTNPVVSHNGLFASVTRETTATDRELYLYARGSTSDAWGIPRKLIELSTPLSESGAALSDDGLQLWFHSDRGTAGGGQLDVYLASRASGFAPFVAAPVTELNTAVVESDPAVTRDLRIMVFERATELMIATR